MSDNFTAPLPSGVSVPFASDEISGVHFPRTKISWGADGIAQDVSGSAPLPTDPLVRTTIVSRSGVVGTSATNLLSANAARRGFRIQNRSATATIYVNELGVAVADNTSIALLPGDLYDTIGTCIPVGAISVLSTEASTPVYAREW